MAREHASAPLAGRDVELLLLERWLHEADDEEPRLVELRGEAGIGKTRVVAEVLDRARRQGTKVLAGRCYEDVEIPLQPLRVALAAIHLGELSLDDEPRSDAHSEVAMALAVTRRVLAVARQRLVVLALDDLHWADPGTTDALFHLVASAQVVSSLPRPRLAIVITTREDEGPERTQNVLRRLRRESITRSVALGGLDELATAQVMSSFLPAPPAPAFVQATSEATGGNPLLVESLMERMCDQHHIAVRSGRAHATSVPARHAVPTELEEAWALRLEKLGPTGRGVLEVAAILGDGCGEADVRAISGLTDDEVDAVLEQAAELNLLYADGVTCHFRHPHVRRALCDALPARRRRMLDAEVVAGLMQRQDPPPDERALVIMQHAQHATDRASADVRRRLALPAARQAEEIGAWAAAARCYEDELSTIDPTDAPAGWGLLELRAAKAHYHNHDFAEAVPHLRRAIALAREAGDLETWGDALSFLTGAHVLQLAEGLQFDPDLVEEFLAAAGDQVPDERAMVLANVAQHHFGQFDVEAAEPALREARRLAEGELTVETRHFVATVHGLNRLGALELDEAGACFREALQLIDGHEDPWQAVWVEVGVPLVDLLQGRLGAADAAAERALASAATTNQWNLHGLAAGCRAAVGLAQGRTEDAERWAHLAIQSYRRSDYFYAGAIGYPHLAAARAYRGDSEGARAALRDWGSVAAPLAARHSVLVAALAGDVEEARRRLDEQPLTPLPPSASLFSLGAALAAAEVGDLLDDHRLVEDSYGHLLAAFDHEVAFGLEWCIGVPRALAMGAVHLGRLDDAHRWLQQAAAAASRAEAPLETARVRVAEAALERAGGASADVLCKVLTPAIEYFEAHQLLALAAQARRLAPSGALARRRDLVICYTDIVESTPLNVRVGDELFLELLREHNRILRRRLGVYGGVEFTHTGDGIGAAFGTVDAAVGFAVGVQSALDAANAERPELALQVRVGLAKGDAMEDEGNLFGATIVRAVRICAAGGAGQVLLGEELALACDPTVADVQAVGEFALKGFGRTELLYQAAEPALTHL